MSALLYHWGCEHSRRGIGRHGLLRPGTQLGAPHVVANHLVWLTSDPLATREQLGLTRHLGGCDRMVYLYEVQSQVPVRWLDSPHRTLDLVRALETDGTAPWLWWVSPAAVFARLRLVARQP